MTSNYQVHTFGCKVNTYDTGLLQKNMQASGFAADDNSHVHLLNTCAVTAEATREAVRVVRRIKAKDPLAVIVVTGCGAQVDTETFAALPGVDLVVANSHKGYLPFLLDQHFKGELSARVFKSNIFHKSDLEAGGGIEPHHSRAFLKIQDGCNSFCTYCIIPFARGKSRSLPVQNLVQRVNELHAQGYLEVVLTGVHVGDYDDQGRCLEDLLSELLAKTKMPRFRLTSLEPVELTSRLIELYSSDRLCPHFHMSIQSANSKVLRDMKRNYDQTEVVQALQNIEQKIPGSFVGMDVIVGFPTETTEDFEDTCRVLSELPWHRIHVFPYSERPGTKAAALNETVRPEERKERAKILRALSDHRHQAMMGAQFGKIKKVLTLKKSAHGANGLSRDYWPVQIANEVVANQEYEARITGFDMNQGYLLGALL